MLQQAMKRISAFIFMPASGLSVLRVSLSVMAPKPARAGHISVLAYYDEGVDTEAHIARRLAASATGVA